LALRARCTARFEPNDRCAAHANMSRRKLKAQWQYRGRRPSVQARTWSTQAPRTCRTTEWPPARAYRSALRAPPPPRHSSHADPSPPRHLQCPACVPPPPVPVQAARGPLASGSPRRSPAVEGRAGQHEIRSWARAYSRAVVRGTGTGQQRRRLQHFHQVHIVCERRDALLRHGRHAVAARAFDALVCAPNAPKPTAISDKRRLRGSAARTRGLHLAQTHEADRVCAGRCDVTTARPPGERAAACIARTAAVQQLRQVVSRRRLHDFRAHLHHISRVTVSDPLLSIAARDRRAARQRATSALPPARPTMHCHTSVVRAAEPLGPFLRRAFDIDSRRGRAV
jgi:hypothetical protein